jgi:sigma-E factor negative regulatory protein RseC
MEEIGTVKKIEGIMAIVDVPKKSACEGCTAGTCRQEDRSMEIEALNRAGAKVGQKVLVSIKAYTYLKGSALVYGLPALALVLGAVLGKEGMSSIFTGTDPDILSAIFGFGAFGLSLVAVKIWSKSAAKKVESKPVVEEILSR